MTRIVNTYGYPRRADDAAVSLIFFPLPKNQIHLQNTGLYIKYKIKAMHTK